MKKGGSSSLVSNVELEKEFSKDTKIPINL